MLRAKGYSHNVWLTLLFKVSNSLSLGIWSVAVLSTYIQMLEGDAADATQKVGYAQAIQGTCLAAAALPLGWLSDHVGRSIVLKGAGIMKFMAIACTSTAVFVPAAYSYTVLCFALGLWGVAQADGPVIESLFADSVTTGARSTIYTTAYGSALAAASVGPLLAAVMFWLHGNIWELQALGRILLVGQAMALVPTIVLFCFSDSKSLGHESEGVLRPLLADDTATAADTAAEATDCEAQVPETEAAVTPTSAADDMDQGSGSCTDTGASGNNSSSASASASIGRGGLSNNICSKCTNTSTCSRAADQQTDEQPGICTNIINDADVSKESSQPSMHVSCQSVGAQQPLADPQIPSTAWRQRSCPCVLTAAAIPAVLAISDCVMGLASGMTVKFFPLFFKDQVRLDPMSVSLLYCAIPLTLAASSLLAQRMSQLLGRVQVIVGFKMTGVSLLALMASATGLWSVPAAIVLIHLVRTAVMNSCYPLQKSILMDFVPKETRARWNSLDSVTHFGWSGSAAVGGWLIHAYGYQCAFTITATVQAVALSLLLLLLPLVPRQEAHVLKAGSHSGAIASAAAVAIIAAEAAVEQEQGAEAAGDALDICEPLLQEQAEEETVVVVDNV